MNDRIEKLRIEKIHRLQCIYVLIKLYHYIIEKYPDCSIEDYKDLEYIINQQNLIEDLINRERKEGGWQHTHHILVSQKEMMVVEKIYDLGFDFILKPYDNEVLLAKIVLHKQNIKTPWYTNKEIAFSVLMQHNSFFSQATSYKSEYNIEYWNDRYFLTFNILQSDFEKNNSDVELTVKQYYNLFHLYMIELFRKSLLVS
jgi:hypothetical protein